MRSPEKQTGAQQKEYKDLPLMVIQQGIKMI